VPHLLAELLLEVGFEFLDPFPCRRTTNFYAARSRGQSPLDPDARREPCAPWQGVASAARL
jgi:hypothetical protein